MKKIVILGFVIMSVVMFAAYVEATTVVKTTKQLPQYDYYNDRTEMYDRDLNKIEYYLFRKTFPNNNLNTRLNRIEKRVFNRIFNSWNPTRRINHILANYRDDYSANNYSSYTYNRPVQKLRNRFVGQPTGFTPSIIDMPFGSGFGNGFGPGYSQGFTSNTGYGFLNTIPAMAGAGIRILD